MKVTKSCSKIGQSVFFARASQSTSVLKIKSFKWMRRLCFYFLFSLFFCSQNIRMFVVCNVCFFFLLCDKGHARWRLCCVLSYVKINRRCHESLKPSWPEVWVSFCVVIDLFLSQSITWGTVETQHILCSCLSFCPSLTHTEPHKLTHMYTFWARCVTSGNEQAFHTDPHRSRERRRE